MEWIIENNGNNYRFVEGKKITIPEGQKEIVRFATVPIYIKRNGSGGSTIGPKGWMLTRTGCLVRGDTGWLVDENGLYILQDGRRLDKSHTKEMELRIGDEDVYKGLGKILGGNIDNLRDKSEPSTSVLFEEYGLKMGEVVYQAFQINICYKNTKQNLVPINSNAKFYSIGEDETGIPIVVTRVGNEKAEKKLVIAGPHGDERNAQRLIMTAQKHFIQNGVPENTVLYFIPCLSPTMAFADARGIPNEFWQGGKKETPMYPTPIVDRGRRLGFSLDTGSITIPKLHDTMGNKMRYNIQHDNGSPLNPKWGVDANRDFHLSIPSNFAFNEFIKKILQMTSNKKDNEYLFSIYNAGTGLTEQIPSTKTFNALRVLMIHGYDDNQPDLCVYGPYTVKKSGEKWPALMSQTDISYVNKIRENLKLSEIRDTRLLIYGNTAEDAKPFQGEWLWQLYDMGIWSADIELNSQYNENVRGAGYDHSKIGVLGDLPEKLINLLKDFPWKK